jgi:hypothetical protein
MDGIYKFIAIFFTLIIFAADLKARSIHRGIDRSSPSITTCWVGGSKTYTITNDHLTPHAFFELFDKNFFDQHMLPDGKLTFRYDPSKSIDATILKKQMDLLFKEIQAHKRRYTHFKVLQKKDFNRRKGHGLIILKFNDFPFVVKLFIERPETFISPYHKGFEQIFFFYMGGGINRHLAGFTRLKTLEQIKSKIAQHPVWKPQIDMPRKWFWLPSHAPWIEITGRNMATQKNPQRIAIPGTYCIIADAIDAERTLSILDSAESKQKILELCNYLNLWLDPHLPNYMIEKKTKKLVLVDTEHFASNVGFKKPVHFDNYISWYLHLAGKFLQNTWGQTKHERRHPEPIEPAMLLS